MTALRVQVSKDGVRPPHWPAREKPIRTILFAFLAALAAPGALAQTTDPSKPVRMLVGFPQAGAAGR
jgi:hypothetical protein